VAFETFIDKKFSAAHRQVIKQANQIIDEYTAMGYSLTLRQIHYQFVARDWYENTQQNYKRLGNILDAGRKAGKVDWGAIEDRTRTLRRIPVWTAPETALERIQKSFKLDPWEEQPVKHRVEVWVEKDAAVGIVEPTCNALRIPYFSCRGYSSSSGLYEAGKRLQAYRDAGYETLILYLGDHDPSGVQMTDVSRERVDLYAGGGISFERIALTLAQVEEHNPPPNFVKETDSRTKWYIEQFETEDCWELDALKPKAVDELIRAHVQPLINQEAWDKTMASEKEHRETLMEIISDWGRTKAAPDMLRMIQEHAGYQVEDQPDAEGAYDHTDSSTLAMLTSECQELLDKHDL
jgi:hypothetical protein